MFVIKCGLSGHYFAYTVLSTTASKDCNKDMYRNDCRFDAKQHVHDVGIALREYNIDWVYDDVERTWSEFLYIFLQISDRRAPVVTRRLKNKTNPRITNDTIKLCTNVTMS